MTTLFWASQVSVYEFSAMTTFFITLGCNLPQVPKNICLGVESCFYFLNFFQTKSKRGFLNPKIH
jgi:hypothetical protein